MSRLFRNRVVFSLPTFSSSASIGAPGSGWLNGGTAAVTAASSSASSSCCVGHAVIGSLHDTKVVTRQCCPSSSVNVCCSASMSRCSGGKCGASAGGGNAALAAKVLDGVDLSHQLLYTTKTVLEQRRTFFTATPINRRRPAGRVNSRTANRNKRQREPKPGDWTCQCGTVNFRARRECYQCNAPAPPLPPGVKRLRLPGEDPHDWACPCGSMNYRGNVNCFKCHMPKPAPPPEAGEDVEFWKCSNCIQINRPKRTYCFQCYGLKADNALPVPEPGGQRLLEDDGDDGSSGASRLQILSGEEEEEGELTPPPPPSEDSPYGASSNEEDDDEAEAS